MDLIDSLEYQRIWEAYVRGQSIVELPDTSPFIGGWFPSNGNTANSWGAFIISSITILRTTFYQTHT